MPLAFPSHQGLILPLWKKWPRHIDPIALSIGAAAPDIVDALAAPIRGELGQGIGHSLIGVLLLATPLTTLLSYGARRLPDRAVDFVFPRDVHPHPTLGRAVVSAFAGALSHSIFDLLTHANLVLFLPWYRDDALFPAWWRTAWVELPLVFYDKPYPIGPHFVAWSVASVVGVLLYARYRRLDLRRA